ncbi:alpha-mannosidase 2 isoform X2 [Conger conger]|uniref:alpha-mannosidase 2 isoform X2 n=1 Tax=Conger conger TaxID=82655 RepID=UPI002A59C020|nr:alpha-mannosidase 2 isoform X2 [Conger conger]
MKLSRQFTVFGSAIFCVVVFSLYLMLDHLQLDHTKNPSNGVGRFQNGQLSILQEKIDHLERLLAENNEIISNIRDSVINLSESVKDGRGSLEVGNLTRGSLPELLASPPLVVPIDSQDCQFATRPYSKSADGVQMLDVYDLLTFDNPDGGVWKQGFDISYEANEWDSEPLQVFVVPHSHNDPGWLKTFDDYYRDQTQHILNNMVVKLHEDDRRKIIWSEISYFSKWWENIDSQKREAVKRLIERGQLEITTGGWVMPDEASSHYFALIDQLLEGHQWLEKNLGVKPKTGWAVDPFGHSPTMAYLLKQAGLSNMLIQRIHYSVKKHFATQKTLEFFWRQNWDPDSSTDILCHMMPFYSYDVPHTCGPDPKICCQFDFKRLPGGRISCPWRVPPQAITEGNVQQRAHMLLDQYRKKSRLFRTKVVLAPLGDDFRYTEALEWDQQFQNYQKLFDYMNSQPELHVKAQFGTISDYFAAVRKAASVDPVKNSSPTLPVVSGDFFTYADRDDHYWSGFFTSRPFYKRLDRVLESHLRAAEILYSLALASVQKSGKLSDFPSLENYKSLTEARRNLGLFQHHDAITGTGKDWVVVDYGTRLFHSILKLKQVIINSAHWLTLKGKGLYSHNPSTPFFHMDDIQPAQDALPRKTVLKLGAKPRSLVIYNPSDQDRSSVVTVYVSSPRVRVLTAHGHPVVAQMGAVWEGPTKASKEAFQLSFVAQVPALGLSVYQMSESGDFRTVPAADYTFFKQGSKLSITGTEHFRVALPEDGSGHFTIESPLLKIWCSSESGIMEKVKNKEDGAEQHVKVEFLWYGTTSKRDKSGAYLFLPDGEGKSYTSSSPPMVRIAKGTVFSEVTTIYEHVTHNVRLYNVQGIEGQSVEISNTVDIRGEVNHEIAMRITSDLNSSDRFFTDLNGFQIQPRKTMAKLPLQANFYPMTTMAYIQDTSARLTLLSGQSLGVASLKSGQLEVMMDRRLMQDDNRGLGQGVQDNKITANIFRLLLEKRNQLDEREKAQPVSYPSLLSHISSMYLNHPFIPMAVSLDFESFSLSSFSPLASSLPCDVHMVNLRTIQSMEGAGPSDEAALILHRRGFDCEFSNRNTGLLCVTTRGKILVEKLFGELTVGSITPASLSLMHTSDRGKSLKEIQLNPMEISTYRIQLR